MTDSFDIQRSAFATLPVHRALIKATREMSNPELQTMKRGFPTSTFEIQHQSFASLPSSLFYSTQMTVRLVETWGIAGQYENN